MEARGRPYEWINWVLEASGAMMPEEEDRWVDWVRNVGGGQQSRQNFGGGLRIRADD